MFGRTFASIIIAFAFFISWVVLAQSQVTLVNGNYDDPVKPFLTDGNGLSLYLYTQDSTASSACDAECAKAWPPLVAEGQPEGGEGVATSLLGTITRGDGTKQVTYNDHPLYRFSNDAKPGETKGEGVGDKWYLVSPYGVAATPTDVQQVAKQDNSANAMSDANQSSPENLQAAGEGVYVSNCAVCHGTNGEGGTGPTLVDRTSLEDTELILSQVIRGGRIMPPFGDELSNDQIAAVATFIRNSWGNEFGAVTPQDVSANR